MYDYYMFPLPNASKWNRPICDPSEVKIALYLVLSTSKQIIITHRLSVDMYCLISLTLRGASYFPVRRLVNYN